MPIDKNRSFDSYFKKIKFIKNHKIAGIVLKLGNKNVATVDCGSDQRLLFPTLPIADFHHLGVH